MVLLRKPSPKRKRSGRSFDIDGVNEGYEPFVDELRGTPTLDEIEELLDLLKQYDPMNVYLTRMQLKWLVKSCDKYWNLKINSQYGK